MGKPHHMLVEGFDGVDGKNARPTVGDLPVIKSQLDSRSFVIGIPSGV